MTRRRSVFGIAVRLVIVTVVALVASFHTVPEARAQDSDQPQGLEIDGVGSYEINDLMQAWGTPMFDSSNPVNLSYVPGGDAGGRTQLALGQVDFAISGMPLTADDNQELAARNVTLIQAPLAMAAGVFVYEAPQLFGLQVLTPDPTDPDGDGTISLYSGDLHLSSAVLARTMAGEETYDTYRDPDFVNDLGLPATEQFQVPSNSPVPVVRSDAGAANYYLEQFVHEFALDNYQLHLSEQKIPADVQSESWPFLDMASRAGPKNIGDLLAGGGDPNGSLNAGGVLAQLDPTNAAKYVGAQTAGRSGDALTTGALARLSELALQNHAGEWVEPTPASITAAGALGGGAPLYGLNEDAPGAYPFTWVDSLYVPSTGLSIDKTNAIATFLRYATGPGQSLAAGVQDGQIPAAMVTQAAEKADEIVKGNCPAAGGTTRTAATGGPDWPTGVPAPSGGALICVAPPAGATTTTAATGAASTGGGTGSTGFGPSSSSVVSPDTVPAITNDLTGGSGGGSDTSESASGSTTPTSEDSVGSGGGDAPTGGALAATAQTVRVDLPLKPPDDGQFALDRFATILLGGVVFVILRSLVRPGLVGRL